MPGYESKREKNGETCGDLLTQGMADAEVWVRAQRDWWAKGGNERKNWAAHVFFLIKDIQFDHQFVCFRVLYYKALDEVLASWPWYPRPRP